ncbi:NYN domain-containing protein [Trichocoleus sp. DQ-A3]|uniref:NYN domain-containing protein n=1 Tax=Cyanophyceae TaxID=3028117 RepID=UPI0016834030|nr:NYN domain-containing protein [Coleofasciculus sp. FACHB-125]MBD1899690.1 NYN domain-containing protein [Coleofasciculus sp. FACHB-125]
MQATHLATKSQTVQSESLVYVGWDLQNVSLKQPNELQKFAKELLIFCRSKGNLHSPHVYYNSQHKNQLAANHILEKVGYKGVNVPIAKKNSADHQLILDCLKTVVSKPSADIFTFVLGDKDYVGLICVLRSLGKKVIIFAKRGSESKKLKSIADEFYFVDELPNLVSNKTVIQKDGVLPYIKYDDAVHCLLEAIKAANSQGKCAVYPTIDKLMRQSQRFPNYKGVSTIRKPDATKFPNFSKFVAAVVKDGKIKLQNKEMLLV